MSVGVVTSPFSTEGGFRKQYAEEGIAELKKYVDTLLIINNDKLIEVYGDLTLRQAFGKANEILNTHEDILDSVANFLLEHETLDHDQFQDIVEGKIPIIKIDKSKESNEGETLTKTELQNKKPGPEPQATS